MTSNLAIRVLIIEDEVPAAEKLERHLKKYSPGISIAAVIPSVKDAVAWLKENQSSVDLIFMDVQLLDGQSFQIFEQVKVEKPVIFITAFNDYALEAFRVKGIDYLLKPVSFADLSASLDQLKDLSIKLTWDKKWNDVREVLSTAPSKTYKSRFMVKLGDHIRSIPSDQIALFFADGRDVYLITGDQKKFIVDYTLESLEEILEPKTFFRANRAYVLNIHFIQDVVVYSNSRLKIITSIKWEPEIIVSREKVNEFKDWFDGNH
jgi:two-component system LytT family response regulator